ncbi:hypothetical protein QT971_29920, partial [Microcoleus sp. herbarium19]|uniref:hypothetical protein n=1 Tax=unclassified Microcoleus TaxID=2642155 RepID=UPI002FD3C0B6
MQPVLGLSFFQNKFNIGDCFEAVVYSKLKVLQYKSIEQPFSRGVEGWLHYSQVKLKALLSMSKITH